MKKPDEPKEMRYGYGYGYLPVPLMGKGAAGSGPPPPTNHLLADNGVDILTDGSGNELTNG